VKGIVVTYPGCLLAEVEPALAVLGDRASLVGLEQIPDHAAFLVLPGGSCEMAMASAPLKALIQRLDREKRLLAGICNGAMVLASAGVLRGHSCTHTAHPKYAPSPEFQELLEAASEHFADSVYLDEDVVVSGHLITAKPWAAQKFGVAINAGLRCCDEALR